MLAGLSELILPAALIILALIIAPFVLLYCVIGVSGRCSREEEDILLDALINGSSSQSSSCDPTGTDVSEADRSLAWSYCRPELSETLSIDEFGILVDRSKKVK